MSGCQLFFFIIIIGIRIFFLFFFSVLSMRKTAIDYYRLYLFAFFKRLKNSYRGAFKPITPPGCFAGVNVYFYFLEIIRLGGKKTK